MLKMRRIIIIYDEAMKLDFRGEIEVKSVGEIHLATNAKMTAIVAKIMVRKNTMSAGIDIGIPPTVNAITVD